MIILAIDPGTEKSAWLVYDTNENKIFGHGHESNETVLTRMEDGHFDWSRIGDKANGCFLDAVVIEQIKSYGNVMGDCVLVTCVWIGRFIQKWNHTYYLVPRKTIVTELCQNPRASDTNVRQALIDRFGGKTVAIGKKVARGCLYGVKNDIWSALAIAVSFHEIFKKQERERWLS